MESSPRVSVIIDNYNYARYLPEAVESCLRQDYPQTETIIVDDGSTDSSRAVIEDFCSRYPGQVTAIFQKNGGQASAFNAGFQKSTGDFVIFLDSDDALLPGAVQQVVGAFERCPGAAKVQYRMEVIDALGQPTGVLKPPDFLALPNGDYRQRVLSFPGDIPWLATSGNAFSAAVLRNIFPIPEEQFRILADFYLTHLTPLFGPVITLPEVGAYYRVHGTNNHELASSQLNLPAVRRNIIYWRRTHWWIEHYAREIGLYSSERDRRGILSVSYVAFRLISLRLDRKHHPFPEDTIWGLILQGLEASRRRFDVSPVKQVQFVIWFLVMATTPAWLATWFAEAFLFPEKRGKFTQLLNQAFG